MMAVVDKCYGGYCSSRDGFLCATRGLGGSGVLENLMISSRRLDSSTTHGNSCSSYFSLISIKARIFIRRRIFAMRNSRLPALLCTPDGSSSNWKCFPKRLSLLLSGGAIPARLVAKNPSSYCVNPSVSKKAHGRTIIMPRTQKEFSSQVRRAYRSCVAPSCLRPSQSS